MTNEIEGATDDKHGVSEMICFPLDMHDGIVQRGSADGTGFTETVLSLLDKGLRRERVRDLTRDYHESHRGEKDAIL